MTPPNSQQPDDWFADDDSFSEEEKSKSQLKREAEQKQKLAETLVNMSDANLAKMPLDDELSDAISIARRINRKKDGFRRQLQFLGKLMRVRDTSPIEQAIALLNNQHSQGNAHFHMLETLRDHIVKNGDDAIESVLEEYPYLERQKLLQLHRKAKKEAEQNKPPTAARVLFKYLREAIEE